MSLLFSFFLCSHYTSFPLSIFNLLFYSPLPFFFCFSHPFVISLFVSHPSPLIPHPDFTFVSYSTFDFPLSPFPPSFGHPVIPPYFCFFLPLVPPSLPPSLPFYLSSSAGCGKWRQVRYWTHWSTTMRQFFICALLTAWWSPAPRTGQLPSGTWPLLLTSAYVVSLWDTGLL